MNVLYNVIVHQVGHLPRDPLFMFSLTFLTTKVETLRVETEESHNGFVATVS